jgi:NAD(P)-dependent dehydrogenase (short-subunit alcohol dehydrogenase family)
MDLALAYQTVVVIGGAKGIGLAIGEAFAEERANVVLADVDPVVSQAAAELSAKHDAHVAAQEVDVTDYVAMQKLAAQVISEHGGCNHLIYAAGVGSGKFGFPFWNLTPDDWDFVLRVNLVGAVNAAHAFQTHMVAQHEGTMLFISSIAGQIGSQTDPPYSAAKAGLINFAQCAAKDLAEHNIRVNTICPGMVKTAVNRSVWQAWFNQQPEEAKLPYEEWADEKVANTVPLARWQECEDVANLALFLASYRANNITGQTMNVDGGQVMH